MATTVIHQAVLHYHITLTRCLIGYPDCPQSTPQLLEMESTSSAPSLLPQTVEQDVVQMYEANGHTHQNGYTSGKDGFINGKSMPLYNAQKQLRKKCREEKSEESVAGMLCAWAVRHQIGKTVLPARRSHMRSPTHWCRHLCKSVGSTRADPLLLVARETIYAEVLRAQLL